MMDRARKTARLLLVGLVVGCCSSSAWADSPFESKSIDIDDKTYPYRLLSPAKIEPEKKYPVVLFLHGAGERGDDNDRQLAYLPRTLSEPKLRAEFPCFVVAPQCPRKERWVDAAWSSRSFPDRPARAMQAAIAALRATTHEHPVDLDRIYVTGLSMGGYGTWDLIARYPEWFAAAVPICGGGDETTAHRLAGLPLWAFHGADDKVIPAERSRAMVDRVRAHGGDPRYTELPKTGHNSWTPAYRKDQALNWMFGQRRDPKRSPAIQTLVGPKTPLSRGERIVFLGDSITQAAVRPGGYIDLIDSTVKEALPEHHIELIGAGISGHKVPDLQKRLDRDVLAKKPTVVFIYIGINDVWHSQSGRGTSITAYESGLRDLIERIRAVEARVILATPTVIGERPRGENPLDAMLDEYAAVSRKVAADLKVHSADLREASVAYLSVHNPENAAQGTLTSDGVHLNAEGNRFLANQAARALFELLSDSSD